MRTRYFTLRSSDLSSGFSSGVQTVTMPRRTRGNSRVAIVGITADCNDDENDKLLIAITSFQVGARQYVQGDSGGVILGMLAPGAVPSGTSSNVTYNGVQNPWFPCSRKINPDGTISGYGIPVPGGKFAGGILVKGGELITIGLSEVQSGSNPLNYITLHCVQFDDAPSMADVKAGKLTPEQLALEAFWAEFEQGIGQVHFHGSTISVASGAAFNASVDAIIHSPYNRRIRRLEYRGEMTTTTAVTEDNFADNTVAFSTDTENPHELDPVPMRNTIGHAGLQYPGALMVDLNDGGHSQARIAGPDPGAASVIRLTGIFEGQPEGDNVPFLCGPNPY